MARDQVVDKVPPDTELGLEADSLLAEFCLEHAPRPVKQYHILRLQGLLCEVHPQVAWRAYRSRPGPVELLVGYAPALDGYGEVAIREAGVAVPLLATGLLDPRPLRGPQVLFFEELAQGVRFGIAVRVARYQAAHRVLDYHGTVQLLGDPHGKVFERALITRTL